MRSCLEIEASRRQSSECRHHLREVLSETGTTSLKILYEHDVGFREFILDVDDRLAVLGHAQSPAGIFLQCPHGKSFAGSKFVELDAGAGNLPNFRK